MALLKYWKYGVMGVLLIAVLWFRGEAIKQGADASEAKAERDTAFAVNEANQQAFARLDEQARANEAIMRDVQTKVAAINQQAVASNAALAQLRRDNAELRAYLDSPIPADVRRLLNDRAR